MGDAITLQERGQPHGAYPVALRAVGRPVALLPYLVDRVSILIEYPLPAFDISPAAERAANVLSLDFLLQDANDDVTLGASW